MSPESLRRRIGRRETHASRATPAILVAVLAIAALAWVVTETVLAAAGQRRLLLSPADMVAGIRGLPSVGPAVLLGGAAVLVLAGIVAVVLAVAPGRLGRHLIDDDRAVVVVDDEVVGSALVRTAADASAIDPDLAEATVGRRSARVRVVPSSGSPVDRVAVASAIADRLETFGLRPAVRGRVVVARKGRVGA